ncbi:MAG: MBL fold metallo-hydrolase [Chitinophagales bacterium]|nr:MBL fold metallo-hydrolase [Chitinophagales bacterium]
MAKSTRCNPHLSFIKEGYDGNTIIDGQYVYKNKLEKVPFEHLAKWLLTKNPQKREKKADTYIPEVDKSKKILHEKKDFIMWLGHATFLIQVDGIRIITDPVLDNISFFLKRRCPLPCHIAELKDIDYIILSHGHRDHLDISSLCKLYDHNPNAKVLCPLNIGQIIRKNTPYHNITEAGWWQRYDEEAIRIEFLPAKHWNRRHLTDFNTTLWGSFGIYGSNVSIYFAGDTALGEHFKQIKETCGAFDYCLMPVGAYKPRFIMEWAHTSPEEAVEAFHHLEGKVFIPMHYGTFDLSDEPAGEPIQQLRQMEKAHEIQGKLLIPKLGELVYPAS